MLENLNQLRYQALDPDANVWVEANAGTGKTRLLIDRVTRLLLEGAAPSKILCLTFTNAAAAEMKERLLQRAGEWQSLEQDKLADALQDLGIKNPSQEIDIARSLYSTMFEEEIGIHTIHGFCQSLLKRFPIEAGVPVNFSLADDRMADEMLALCRSQVLKSPELAVDESLQKSFDQLTKTLSYSQFSSLLSQALSRRDALSGLFEKYTDDNALKTALCSRLDLTIDELEDTHVLDQACSDDCFDKEKLAAVVKCLMKGSKTDQTKAQKIHDWIVAPSSKRRGMFEAYCSVFMTQQRTARKPLATKSALKNNRDALTFMKEEFDRLYTVVEKTNAIYIANHSMALLSLARVALKIYRKIKRDRNILDYDDLIYKSHALLNNQEQSDWVLYKLDGGIDHILLDEAQDTSPYQWKIVESVLDDFYSGQSKASQTRTLFVVGDAKQSIYSFQGADIAQFYSMKKTLKSRIEASKKVWREINLTLSFRSTVPVLQVVDDVFQQGDASSGVVFDEPIHHETYREKEGGVVAVWPLVEKDEELSSEIDFATQSKQGNLHTKAAEDIAERIASWISEERVLTSKGRAVTPGDIMILCRKRHQLFQSLPGALKRRGIDVGGIDRLKILDDIAVQDCLALINFVLLPSDDMSLACVLKSPFIGLSEEALFELCVGRNDKTLWQRIIESAKHQDAVMFLQKCLSESARRSPCSFIRFVLYELDVFSKFISRLGGQVEEVMVEFIELANAFEKNHVKSLQLFLEWIQSYDRDLKREFENADHDHVRIMTVHGSKGLQAPIVILADAALRVERSSIDQTGYIFEDDGLVFWAPSRKVTSEYIDKMMDEKNEQLLQEHHRLLYVAMTRAEDELYVAGFGDTKKMPDGAWYQYVSNALGDVDAVIASQEKEVIEKDHHAAVALTDIKIPDWAFQMVDGSSFSTDYLAPSTVDLQKIMPAVQKNISDQHLQKPSQAKERGILIHKLLEYLPEFAAEKRAKIAEEYLKKRVDEGDQDIKDIIASTLNVLEDEKLKVFFGENSYAEVPVISNANNRIVSGQIDRVAVTNDEVLILDFKTGSRPHEMPVYYEEQIESYIEAMQKVYPNHRIRGYILWIVGNVLDEITLKHHV